MTNEARTEAVDGYNVPGQRRGYTSCTASSSDVLNDSTASNISFASSNVSNDAEGEPNTEEELLIHEKKSTVEEKTVKRVPRE